MKTVYGESDAAFGAAASEKRMAPSGQQPRRLGPCPWWGAVGPLTQTVSPAGKEKRGHDQAGLTAVTAVGSMRRVTGVGARPEAVPRLSGMGSHLDEGSAAGDERRVSQTSALLVAPLCSPHEGTLEQAGACRPGGALSWT